MRRKRSKGTVSARNREGPDPVDIHVGERLKWRRNILGLSQGELGSALGLTFQQIQKYERGTNRIGSSRLHQLSQLLGVSIAWFFEGLQNPVLLAFSANDDKSFSNARTNLLDTDVNPELLKSRESLKFLRLYYSITDPKHRHNILEVMKSLVRDKRTTGIKNI